ncbi:family 16 glycoside hydrolase [Coraliomargarita akajimensis]|uniref:3-keto-disaccharide hydrolase domain-containing protein n=1 Tax=Coraliomargarita akajimensis (strain DSM 45221 / IAM 15411 / JCM 23193 / KCTC 12865 / 04OKA010-24) TaxID=583355 RepID=D5ERA6_CORAD|nr:family 16 glycoside hydrolase [Coraliomargarita akajimensis]ADE55950.1 protein of unknown function DUF1080 [Coraliomargarita akajimensis DSM 45221]
MKQILPVLCTAAVSVCAAVDFIPSFPNDKPVHEGHKANIDKALPTEPIVQPKAKRRLLVVSSTAGFRHGSIPTGKYAIEQMGLSSGAYETVLSDDPANFEPEVLKTFDAVLMLNSTNDFFMPTAKTEREKYTDEEWKALRDRHYRLVDNLLDFVEQGGGLAGIHAATDACYGHKKYGEAMGGYFWGHPWTADKNVTIVVEDPEHAVIKPVFEGMSDFRVKDEIYQFREPYSRERLRVLLNLDPERSDEPKHNPKREDGDYAVSWVQKVGEGRVFYSSLGHNHHMYWNPLILKHYLAGLQFAMGDIEADTTPSAKVKMPAVTDCCGHKDADGWIQLFDGKSLKGWTQRDGKATYEVRDGAIVGTSALATPNSFLCTEQTFADFELEFEVYCGQINSGVQIRSKATKPDGKVRVNGPQIEIERGPGQAGFIYGEGYFGWVSPEPKSEDESVSTHNHFKNDDWNHYRVVAKGPRIQTTLNGQVIADFSHQQSYNKFDYKEGFIGLQVHAHAIPGVEIKWRNIRIREL